MYTSEQDVSAVNYPVLLEQEAAAVNYPVLLEHEAAAVNYPVLLEHEAAAVSYPIVLEQVELIEATTLINNNDSFDDNNVTDNPTT